MKAKLSALSLAIIPLFASATAGQPAINKITPSYEADSVIVVYKETAQNVEKASARNLVTAKISDVNRDEIDDRYQNILAGRLAKYTLDKKMSAKEAIQKLSNHPAVLYVEPDYHVQAIGMPDDTDFGQLWGMHNTGQTGGTVDADIDAPEAWDISTGDRNVVVAVIDTGVDYTHSDLSDNMWVNPNEIPGDGIDNDANGYIDDVYGINAIDDSGDPMDVQGHGTHVAGTIGATGNNAHGVVGVNHEVSIVGCKFLGNGGGATSDAIKCIDYMVGLKNAGHDVRVLNNSWGGGGFSQALADSITSAEQADMLFVAAAGNGAVDNDTNGGFFPSSYEHESVLAVASTDHNDALSGFSQWGLTTVDMGAPGSDIVSTVPGEGYASYNGTSMATPHVAGAAALALSINPALTNLELKELLMTSGDAIPALDGKTVSGKRLNALSVLEQANPEPSFRVKLTPASQTITAGDTATYTFEIRSIAEWSGTVDLALTSSLAGASLSATSGQPGDIITLTAPTTADTAWGDYNFTIDATSGDLAKSVNAGLYVNPQGLREFTYSNNNSIVIPDGEPTGVTSVISIPDDITTFGTATALDISHTFIGDLIITLTSPSGTTATLHNQSGGSADDIKKTVNSDAFNGEVVTGDWTMRLEDTFLADEGTLNSWSLTFTGIGEVGPAAPIADYTYQRDGLNVTFTNTSTDVNDDIVSHSWDFGDTNTSTEASPIHSYATAGTYTVALTTVDAEGLSSTSTQEITVSEVDIELSVKRANLSRAGFLRVELAFENASEETLNVYRNGEMVGTAPNNGVYRDYARGMQETNFTYKVCQTGDICSNEVNVNFE